MRWWGVARGQGMSARTRSRRGWGCLQPREQKRAQNLESPLRKAFGERTRGKREGERKRKKNVRIPVRPRVTSVCGRLPADQRRHERGQRYPNRDQRSQRVRKGYGIRGAWPLGRETRRGEISQFNQAETVHHPLLDHHVHLRATVHRQERVQQHLEGEWWYFIDGR